MLSRNRNVIRSTWYSKYMHACLCLLDWVYGVHIPTACTRWKIKELIIILVKTRQKLMSHSNARLITLRRRVRLFTLIPLLSMENNSTLRTQEQPENTNCRFSTMKTAKKTEVVYEKKTRHTGFSLFSSFHPSRTSSTERLQTHRKNEERQRIKIQSKCYALWPGNNTRKTHKKKLGKNKTATGRFHMTNSWTDGTLLFCFFVLLARLPNEAYANILMVDASM